MAMVYLPEHRRAVRRTLEGPGSLPSSVGADCIEFIKDWRRDQGLKGKPCGLLDFRKWYADPGQYEKDWNTSVSGWVGFPNHPERP